MRDITKIINDLEFTIDRKKFRQGENLYYAIEVREIQDFIYQLKGYADSIDKLKEESDAYRKIKGIVDKTEDIEYCGVCSSRGKECDCEDW